MSKTKEILKNEAYQEIYKCSSNPIYFIKNYCKIRHPKRGLIPFDLYPYQEDFITNFLAYDKNIVNKARQLGFSTLVAAIIVWLILFHKDKEVMVVSTRADVAKNLVKKVKLMLTHIPGWMYLADITINQAHQIGLSNGSSVKSVARGEDAGRSEALALLVIDEAAHIRDMAELWKGLASVTSTGGKTIALSTPKGVGNWFCKYCRDAIAGENQWHYQEVYWWDNPEYSEGLYEDPNIPGGKRSPWFDNQTEGWTNQQIAQELLTSFTETGDTFLDPATITWYEEQAREPLKKIGIDRNFWIFKEPEAGKKYLVGCDVSSGTSDDFSTAIVVEPTELEIVAEYKGKMPPDVFADFLSKELGPMYNMASIIVENNSVGMVTAFSLRASEYSNLLYIDEENNKLIDRWLADYQGINPGFRTTVKNRPIILQKMEEMLRKHYLLSYSKRLTNEFYNFIWKNGKAQARKETNDDLIMALAIAVWVRESFFRFSSSVTQDMLNMYGAVTVNQRNTENEDFPNAGSYAQRQRQQIRQMMENKAKLRIGDRVINMDWIHKL